MKKALARLALGLFIELPIAAAVAHISIRIRQLSETHTDEEIKALLTAKYGMFLLPIAAKLKEAKEASTATGQRAAAEHRTSGYTTGYGQRN